ncbi:hypothetical protein [Salinivibrio kushneri]|uniref:Uncharacterized protein n=1 Tax=Salinivibrio kushneri TaxID=1908198 RepID=A0AB36K5Y3_9GAMM|nr:hypothetical protein [Salinivibrio kushneri]OOE43450.1 hypothetical protein BZG09_10745 [Salinivibrio kushneri]
MRKALKLVLFFICSVIVAAALLVTVFVKITPADNGSESQIIGNIIWHSAPDGGVGFRILKEDHPEYRIKIMMNSPDIVYYEGALLIKSFT